MPNFIYEGGFKATVKTEASGFLQRFRTEGTEEWDLMLQEDCFAQTLGAGKTDAPRIGNEIQDLGKECT